MADIIVSKLLEFPIPFVISPSRPEPVSMIPFTKSDDKAVVENSWNVAWNFPNEYSIP